ncbi:mitochondrial inner membrane protease subunit 2 isoform X5 [Paralichthys olivaceus]
MAQQATAGWRYVRAFVSGLFVAVPVTVTVLDRFAYVARVEGASMQPSLNPDSGSDCDVVLLNRWSVRNYEVQRGDIVSVVRGTQKEKLQNPLEEEKRSRTLTSSGSKRIHEDRTESLPI